LRKADLFKTVLPSKIFESAAMARPIILGVEGESAELLRLADAGVCIEPENAQQLTDSLIHLADHPAERRRLGQNGREFVLTHFDRRVLADAYLALLLRVAAQQETVMA
jgi:glycosyltransferase involved in cell wall biosynthesis